MDWLKMIGFCLLCAAMVLVLRQMNPQISGILTVVFSVLLVGMILPEISSFIDSIRGFLRSLSMEEQYFQVLLKAMGIVLVTQFTAQMCRDLEAPSVAARAEFCGRVALLGVAAPVFMHLTDMAVSVLK